jgi:hypothetical protein
VSGEELSPQKRAERVQKQMQEYLDLVQKKAAPDRIKQAEENLTREMGKDRFEAFKRQLPRHMRALRGVATRRAYTQFRLPGRERMVHDRRAETRERPRGRERGRRVSRRAARQAMRLREGKLIGEKGKKYINYLNLEARMRKLAQTQKPEVKAQIDELLSRFEKMLVQVFEEGAQFAKKSKDGKPAFLKKTDSQWKKFFSRFAGRILKKKVPTKNIQGFLFRGMVPKGAKGLIISDMTLASGRVERFVRFSILAEAMAKLSKLLPGDAFGKEMLTGEELYYLALASARGREYATAPKPTPGRFMGGVAEERAAQQLGLTMTAQLKDKTAELKRGRKLGAFGWGKEKEPYEETPYQFIPWWHWDNLRRPGKFKMITVAFYLALGLTIVIGILAITQHLLK